MRRLAIVILVVCALLATAGVVEAARPDHAGKPPHAGKPARRNFVVHLTGDQERPDKVDTTARGVGVFHLSKDGATLRWMLVLNDITDVTKAHIHGRADAANTAGVLLTLFDQKYEGERHGLVLRGTITRTADNQAAFNDAVQAMRDSMAYANVHTLKNGDGEIRGQFGAKGGFGRHKEHGKADGAGKPGKVKKGKGHGKGGGAGD